MSWHLACDACAKGLETKTIGLLWTHDICEVCGATVPKHPNGISAGHPLTEEQFKMLLAQRGA